MLGGSGKYRVVTMTALASQQEGLYGQGDLARLTESLSLLLLLLLSCSLTSRLLSLGLLSLESPLLLSFTS
jgi:hypothetical protein